MPLTIALRRSWAISCDDDYFPILGNTSSSYWPECIRRRPCLPRSVIAIAQVVIAIQNQMVGREQKDCRGSCTASTARCCTFSSE